MADFPDIYMDNEYNPCIQSPNAPYAIFFRQTRETLFGDTEIYKRFIDNAISRFRKTRVYTNYKSYLYELGLTHCAILGNIDKDMAELQMHHNGITIFDIAVMIVTHKLITVGSVTTFEVISELRKVHTQNKVPLVMLTTSIHQMTHHNDEFFVPISMTFGYWTELLQDYKYGITYGIAKKLKYWIQISLEHSIDENLNADLLKLRDEVEKWSEYNEYYLNCSYDTFISPDNSSNNPFYIPQIL